MTQPPVPPGNQYQYQPQPPSAGNGLAVASLVIGIISLVLFCAWPVAIVLGVVAVVLGVLANQKVSAGQAQGGGMAKAGMVLGIIGVLFGLVIGIMWIAGIHMARRGAQNLSQKLQEESERLQKQADEMQRQQERQRQQQQPTSEPGTRLDQPPPWRMMLDLQTRTIRVA